MQEKWKVCPIAPEFEVSNWGRVRWEHNKKWAAISMGSGYQVITRSTKVTDTAKQEHLLVHRMVAITFVDGYEEGLVVNHIDGCKTNNRADNLEWVTVQTNISNRYNPNKKYDQDFIDTLYDDIRVHGLNKVEVGKKHKIAQPYVGVLLSNNVSSKDIEPIKLLYSSNLYSIKEISNIYGVKEEVIKNIV